MGLDGYCRYAHHIEGAGSIVQMNLDSGVDLVSMKCAQIVSIQHHANTFGK